jgi:hypothetical protein
MLTYVLQLAAICASKFGKPSESAMLFPTARIAEHCRAFLAARDVTARVVQFTMPGPAPHETLYAVLFPECGAVVAKQFWQHTGLGVSSRRADHCLALLATHATPQAATKNRHYAAKPARAAPVPRADDAFERDQALFLEERYGRNLSAQAATEAKRALRLRIAGVLVQDERGEIEVGVSVRGASVQEHDVYLYPTGMAAIWSAHQLVLGALGERKSVCFGYAFASRSVGTCSLISAGSRTQTRSSSSRNGAPAATSSARASTQTSTSWRRSSRLSVRAIPQHRLGSRCSPSSRRTRSCAPRTCCACAGSRTSTTS